MKKIVLIFGLLSGALASLFMTVMWLLLDREVIEFERSEVIGYSAILLSFLLVFFGIRSYRENVGGGTISFGRGVAVGILITAISSLCYVLTWQVIYFNFAPDFVDKMAAHEIAQMRSEGASEAEIAAQQKMMENFKRLYANPFLNAAITLIEPVPVGFVVTLVSAAILRRRTPAAPAARMAALVS